MFFPAASVSLLNPAWLPRSVDPLSNPSAVRRMEAGMKAALSAAVATTPTFCAPSCFVPQQSAHLSGMQLHPTRVGGPGSFAFGSSSVVAVRQDSSLTPAASVAQIDEAEEEADEALDEGDAEEEEDEGFNDEEIQFLGEGGGGGGEGFDIAEDAEEDDDGAPFDDSAQRLSGEYADHPQQSSFDEDEELDRMNPRDMTEEQQIRHVMRMHERERQMQEAHEAEERKQSHQPIHADDGDASHVTPPTRSVRAAAASGSAAASAASAVPPPVSHPSRASASVRVQGRYVPSTARRVLELDSSNDSSMQIDTPPPRAAAGSRVPQSAAAAASHSTPPAAAAPSSAFSSATRVVASNTSPSVDWSAEDLSASLGLDEAETRALIEEQRLLLEQAQWEREDEEAMR